MSITNVVGVQWAVAAAQTENILENRLALHKTMQNKAKKARSFKSARPNATILLFARARNHYEENSDGFQ